MRSIRWGRARCGPNEVASPKIVPELLCSDLSASLAFYVGTCGFRVRYARPEDDFAYLDLDGAELMLEQIADGERSFIIGPLERPFGRGMNLQIEVADVDALHLRVGATSARIVLALEERWYRRDREEVGNRQFIVADPDDYLLRFSTDLGRRAARAT
jgi:catechol 2,3-dioxygenase-like lactoylglutathione lyase family enzyme